MASSIYIYTYFEVGHLSICFWALGSQISDGRHIWVGESGLSFSHDGWLASVNVCCSKVSLQFLHSSRFFLDALVPRLKVQPSKSVHRPWKLVSVSGSRLGLFQGFLPLYFLGLEACPLFPSFGIFDSSPSGGRDGFYPTIPSPFLDLSCSYVEFTFFVWRNSYGLIMTEICINSLLSRKVRT